MVSTSSPLPLLAWLSPPLSMVRMTELVPRPVFKVAGRVSCVHTDFAGRGDESERELKCKATGSRKRPSSYFQDYLCRENQDTWERLRRAFKRL